ncbi:MAG: hypothetical protein HY459_03675 [Parcubacteria group bacterium]|nr:hypothetical protein [Parcubacteria group bacterium]
MEKKSKGKRSRRSLGLFLLHNGTYLVLAVGLVGYLALGVSVVSLLSQKTTNDEVLKEKLRKEVTFSESLAERVIENLEAFQVYTPPPPEEFNLGRGDPFAPYEGAGSGSASTTGL